MRAWPAERAHRGYSHSLSNFVICLTAWLLGPKFGTLSVAVYLLIGLVGVPVFSGYGAGIAKLAGPTGGYLVGLPAAGLQSAVCSSKRARASR
mgnify:CR=1 FL=1